MPLVLIFVFKIDLIFWLTYELLLKEIPESSFSCRDLSPGFYADPEGECQVR